MLFIIICFIAPGTAIKSSSTGKKYTLIIYRIGLNFPWIGFYKKHLSNNQILRRCLTVFWTCFWSTPFTYPPVSMLFLHTHWILKKIRPERNHFILYRPGQVEELSPVFIVYKPTGRCTLSVGWLLIIIIIALNFLRDCKCNFI